jgi:alkylation response protein AidB-like acyl-CoA dehydrogenase
MIPSALMTGPPEAGAIPPLTALSDDERFFRASVREFAERAVRPLVARMDDEAAIPRALIDQLFGIGVMGVLVPEAIGGQGGTFFHAVLAVEELSRVDPAVGVFVDVQNTLVVNAVRRWAGPDLAPELLAGLASARVGAYALSEAEAGSDAFALQTRAVPDGDTFVLHGRKLWITNAAEADVFVVFATVDPSAGYHGITAFVVDRATPGLEVGRREHKLGIRASSTCEVRLDGCRVPASRVLGAVGQGYKVAIETLNEGRIGIGAQMIGLSAAALEQAVAHVKTRRQFGKAVAEFQGVQFQLARAATDLEAARLLVYNAARLRDAGATFATEAAMCKLFASEVAERTSSLAVNLLGGQGFVGDSGVEKLYRDAKVGQIYEGTSNLQLVTIAKQILR